MYQVYPETINRYDYVRYAVLYVSDRYKLQLRAIIVIRTHDMPKNYQVPGICYTFAKHIGY